MQNKPFHSDVSVTPALTVQSLCTLQSISVLYSSVLGVEKLMQCLIREWICDIQRNQKTNLFKGLGLFNSVIQFFEGFSYLIWCPIEQYRKDGRVLFGIKKGSAAFSTCTILATIELTNRMFLVTKNIAEFFYDLVTPHQNPNASDSIGNALRSKHNRNIRYRPHPTDIREGFTNAYFVLFEGINDSAANIVNEIHNGSEHTGMTGAIGGALRQLPSAAVTPFVLGAEAACNILSGIRNQLKPDEKRDDEQKYKSVSVHINGQFNGHQYPLAISKFRKNLRKNYF